MNGTLEDEFQKASRDGQFRIDGISIAKTFRANHEETWAIFDIQAADRPVRFPLERIRHA